jgi:hypothetical protein
MQAKDALPQLEWPRYLAGESRGARAPLPAAILAATFLAYSGTLALGFVLDNHLLILTNDSIRSWHYFPGYFASHVWSFRYPHLLTNYYRPLSLTWLLLNYMLFGLHPWGWHLTSVFAHVAVTFLVYRLCFRLTGDAWVATVAGLLFGLHPVHVEAVAYINTEPLSIFLMLGALLAFCRSQESRHRLRWLATSLALTVAALLSKESGMVLPILIGGYVWIYAGAGGRESAPGGFAEQFVPRLRSALLASLPFWAVVLAYVPMRIWALKGFAHVITPLPLSTELFTIPSVLLFYLRLLVWPSGLSCYYDTPYVSAPGWRDFILPAAVLASVAVALAFWYRHARQRAPQEAKAIAFATFLTILTLVPVLNFRFLPEGEIAHDRYVYLPSVGFALLVAIALRQALRGRGYFQPRPAWVAAGTLVACLLMGFATLRQSLYWSDDLSLNFRAHEIAPHNISATTSLAAAVAQRGMDGLAMALYQQALAIQPDFWRANVNLAYLYYAHGDFPEAARFFARACAADPTDGDQFLYLGVTEMQLNHLSQAEAAIRTALLVRPHGKDYHLGLGLVLKQAGRLREARKEFAASIAEDPNNQRAEALLAETDRLLQGQTETPANPPR